MAQIIWTEPALLELDEIANYIALDKPSAAAKLVKQIFERIDQLADFPSSGKKPVEIKDSAYLEIIIKPCRVFYRYEKERIYILFILRSERDLRKYLIENQH
jgi:toxin ParE1/3/4